MTARLHARILLLALAGLSLLAALWAGLVRLGWDRTGRSRPMASALRHGLAGDPTAGPPALSMLHSILLSFVFSMILGHAALALGEAQSPPAAQK